MIQEKELKNIMFPGRNFVPNHLSKSQSPLFSSTENSFQ